MSTKIIVDSSCDLSPEVLKDMNAVKIPLMLRLGNKEYIDDDTLDLPAFMTAMANCKEKVGSAAPAPTLYQEAYEAAGGGFVVTLSSQLSASYANAMIAKDMVAPEISERVHVFDSKTGTAGETLISLKVRDLIREALPFEKIVSITEKYIRDMKTYFVLERHDNLEKNGRLSKVKGLMIKVLNMKLVMGADDNGAIELHAKPRGMKRMIATMLDMIAKTGRGTKQNRLVITHCNNAPLANEMKGKIESVPFPKR